VQEFTVSLLMEVDGVNRRVFITLGSAVSVVFLQAQQRKKGTRGWAMINGIRASTRHSKETMAKARAAI
jgi:hypothetical protein